MSAISNPYGLQPIYSPGGGRVPLTAINGAIASGYSSAIGFGTPVQMNTSGQLIQATTSSDIWGVFMGVEYYTPGSTLEVKRNNWLANATYTAGTCIAYVVQDPNTQFVIQSNGSIAAGNIGNEANFVNPGGVNGLGFSTAQINSSLVGNGVQGQLRILNVSQSPLSAWGDNYTDVIVEIAQWQTRANKVAV